MGNCYNENYKNCSVPGEYGITCECNTAHNTFKYKITRLHLTCTGQCNFRLTFPWSMETTTGQMESLFQFIFQLWLLSIQITKMLLGKTRTHFDLFGN